MRVPSKVNVSSRKAGLLVTVALCGATLAGCAESSRLSDPFGNPFEASSRYADKSPTASTPRPSYNSPSASSPTYSAPLGRVQSRPLSAPGASASYSAPAMASPRLASAPSAAPIATGGIIRSSGPGGWTGQGGPQVTVGQGESAKILADRYGVPPDALLRVNGYSNASQIAPGTRLTIPVYSSSASAAAAAAPVVAAKPLERAEERTQKVVESSKMKFVKGPDAAKTTAKDNVAASADAGKHAAKAKLAAAKSPIKAAKVEDDDEDEKPVAKPAKDASKVKKAEVKAKSVKDDVATTKDVKGKKSAVETRARTAKVESKDEDDDDDAPAVKPAKAKQAAVETRKVEAKPVAEAPKAQPQQKVAKVESEAKKIDKTPTASLPTATESKPAVSDAANPEFRWPARGRIIQGFKSGGNDGINIAVPEGTSVKAAEGGTVAYAGSELKGYGNLVLIRHPNGFVSAYAHNGDIEVKRGDTVKRGQTIAKSGQSGNVASPQLHFELRKGSTPVDPTGYLAGL